MHPMLNTAVKAARAAGKIIVHGSQNLNRLTVTSKRENDFVSEVDQKAEQAIITILLDAYPDHAILAEETGESGATGDAEYQWVIDPLDGTTNFLHDFPQYAVSIALLHRGKLDQAVIYDPVRNDLYTASRGSGAFLNERRIRVGKRDKLQDALIGTGFPYRDFTHLDAYTGMFRDLVQKTSGLRRPGSAALDLAWLAAGRTDGFFEIGLNVWDIAAGCLLVIEAGGLVSDFGGEENYLQSGNVIAGSPKVFVQLLQTIQPHVTEALRR
ncbi:MAG: inositol monophosphatase family protein [Pseudomonadota bacterium]|nr:inositol monophosphatase family protein [Pseudomonadota bacterium]MDP1906120.1 inositol monophosphatase family protein [Pseudomonadota bacterium]MDP2352579.1 inositol monophosphatase family protein [Pseudomonadota bacterium]